MTGVQARRTPKFKMIAAVVWLITTLSLAGWWLIFGLNQLQSISSLQNADALEIARRHRMLMSEGMFLFVLLLAGGIALLYFMFVEMRRARQIGEFFAAFTHDLKTSLASLRLQAEALEEDLRDSAQAKISRRLVKDTVRLELQLNNSLFVADTEMSALVLEDVSVKNIVNGLRHYWPELDIRMDRDILVHADVRALDSILKNLIQNSVVHGKATQVVLHPEVADGRVVRLQFTDNGKGFEGDPARLGDPFVRQTSTSGSGIGLYLVRKLTKRMGGEIKFVKSDVKNPIGFRVQIDLPGRLV